MKKILTKKELRHVIKQSLIHIFEERGVSSNVIQQVNYISKKIKDLIPNLTFQKQEYYFYDNNILHIDNYEFTVTVLTNILSLNKIILNIYKFRNNEQTQKLFNILPFDSEYDYANNTLTITFPIINNVINFSFLKRMLGHELQHYLKYKLTGKVNNKTLYQTAQKLKKIYPKNSVVYQLAECIYWLDNNEIYSNTQAMYADIMEKKTNNNRGNERKIRHLSRIP